MSDAGTGSVEWELNLSEGQYEINNECRVRAPEPSRERGRVRNGDLRPSLHGAEENPGIFQPNKPVSRVFRRGRSGECLQQRALKTGIRDSLGLGTLAQPLKDPLGPG